MLESVKVETINYAGWKDALRIHNGLIEAVVVPCIGRLMSYGFCGGPNMLWHQDALAGKSVTNADWEAMNQPPDWMNFGGDKVWPTEQDYFEPLNGFAWPPDPVLDALHHEAVLLAQGVEMTSQVSPGCGVQIKRRFTLKPGESRLHIEQWMDKVHAVPSQVLEPIPLTLWNITQIPVPEWVLFPIHAGSRFQKGVRIWPGEPNRTVNLGFDGCTGWLKAADAFDQKIGTDGAPWLAAVFEQTAFVERFVLESGMYPDQGCTTEIYTCADYVELELLSPVQPLKPGESMGYHLVWDLKKLSSLSTEARKKETLDWLMHNP